MRKVPAAGLTPTSPANDAKNMYQWRGREWKSKRGENILMTEAGTVETPVFARIAKLPAERRLTAAGPRAATAALKLAAA